MGVTVDGDTMAHPPPVSTVYWPAPQMVAHVGVNGASLRPGDFFGSGAAPGPNGSLMELGQCTATFLPTI